MATTDSQQEESLRDTLAAAFDQAEAAAEPAPPAPQPQPAAIDPQAAEPGAQQPADAPGQPRDEKGRFSGKQQADAQAQAAQRAAQTSAQAQPAQRPGAMPPAPAPADLKAPVSWKPHAREKWAGVDPDIQAEIHRREAEHQQTMQNAAQSRQFMDAFQRVVQPYELLIRSENSTPLDAVDNLMRMAAVMRTGSPADKVNLVAGLISQWSVDIGMLDQVMAARINGQQSPYPTQSWQQQQPPQQQFRDPRVDQLLAQQQQAQQAAFQREIDAFAADAKNEFFNDVKPLMSDLITMAATRGQVLSLADAYAQACRLDENVSKILSQRASARDAGANTAAALRARRAAASVKGDSTLHDGATVPRDDSIRASLEAAFEESERRSAR